MSSHNWIICLVGNIFFLSPFPIKLNDVSGVVVCPLQPHRRARQTTFWAAVAAAMMTIKWAPDAQVS